MKFLLIFILALPIYSQPPCKCGYSTIYGKAPANTLVYVLNIETLELRLSRTNPFGYFSVGKLPAAQTYVIFGIGRINTEAVQVFLMEDVEIYLPPNVSYNIRR